jgi:uncharacterized membrane protein YedE/YeeE
MSRTEKSGIRPGVVVGGAGLGFVLSRVGFTSFDDVHAMFTFGDLRLIGVFAVAVVVVGIGLRLLPAGRALPARELHRGLVPGGVLFGLGWAVSGACPGATLAMVGEGQAAAVLVLVGIFVGSALATKLRVFAST